MKRGSFVLIAISVLGGLALYYAGPGWLALLVGKKMSSPAAQSQTPRDNSEGGTAGAMADVAQVKGKDETVDEGLSWGRNPFLTEAEEAQALGLASAGLDRLKVRAIIVGRPKPVATIDGKTVMVGEKVGEETVAEIREDHVVLERDGKRRVLKVGEPSVSIEVKEVKRR